MAKKKKANRKYGRGRTVKFTDFHIGISSVNFRISGTTLDEFVRQFENLKTRATQTEYTITLTRTSGKGLPDRLQVSAY